MTSTASSTSDPSAFVRSVARLGASGARLSLVSGRIVCDRPGLGTFYLADDLCDVEALLVRLMERWGDGYGACLFFELWGSDAQRYGPSVRSLRGHALTGPAGRGAGALITAVAGCMEATGAKDKCAHV